MTVKSFADIKDSKLLYEKQMPAFGFMLLVIIA